MRSLPFGSRRAEEWRTAAAPVILDRRPRGAILGVEGFFGKCREREEGVRREDFVAFGLDL